MEEKPTDIRCVHVWTNPLLTVALSSDWQQQRQQQPNYCAECEATQGLSGGQAGVAVLDIYGEAELTAAMYNTLSFDIKLYYI